MQETKSPPILIILGILAVLGILLYLFSESEPKYDWYSHDYRDEAEEPQPYDSDLLLAYLSTTRDEQGVEELAGTLQENLETVSEADEPLNYIINGPHWMDEDDVEAILDLVEEGHSVFLLNDAVNSELLYAISDSDSDYDAGAYWEEEDEEYYAYDSPEALNWLESREVEVNFYAAGLHMKDKGLRFEHVVQDYQEIYQWAYLDLEEGLSDCEALGDVDGEVNFMRWSSGDGHLYVLTTPKLLSNYYLLEEEGRAYADRMFAYLGEGPIYWDKRVRNLASDYDRTLSQDGPFEFLLSKSALRYALYTGFVAALIFMVVGSQRDRRPIPVIKAKESSATAYVHTVSQLHFQQAGHFRIFGYLLQEFDRFVRDRYRIKIDWKNKDHLALLSKKAGIGEDAIEKLRIVKEKGAYESNVDSKLLKDFYLQLNRFYKNAK